MKEIDNIDDDLIKDTEINLKTERSDDLPPTLDSVVKRHDFYGPGY